ncbi:MAG: 30S ribosomal protein S6 [Coleofasciculaceae cyanobacterium]
MSDHYEMMYILRPDLGEEQVDQVIAKYENILREQGAETVEIQHRGRRRLAYEIQRQREGIYVQMNYKAPGAHVAIIERAMRLSEEVIRYLTLKVDAPAVETPEAVEVEAVEAVEA